MKIHFRDRIRNFRANYMKLLSVFIIILITACQTVPITGRQQLNIIPSEPVLSMSYTNYREFLSSHTVIKETQDAEMVKRVGRRIRHAVAQHGDERMSQGLLAQMGGVALSTALSEKPKETTALFMTAYGLGTQVGVLLPYSRLQESEADRLGLVFMAMAGYDPHNAIDFWKRMASAKQGASPPEFLSTHPADDTRIRNMEKLIPEAMRYYRE